MEIGTYLHILKLAGISVFAETPQFLGKMKNITAYEGTEKVTFTCVLQDTGDQQMVFKNFFFFETVHKFHILELIIINTFQIKWFHNDRRATQIFQNGFYIKQRENAKVNNVFFYIIHF